jgi:hypothetical protein
VRVYRVLTLEKFTAAEAYLKFLMAWPFVFGLSVALGTIAVAWSGKPHSARWLWWSYALLIVFHAALLIFAMASERASADKGASWTWDEIRLATVWYGTTALLLGLLPVSRILSRNWCDAAMGLQLALALSAASCLSLVIPALTLANRFLVGGKLAVASSVALIVATLVLWLDGHRALTRQVGESPLRLSLRSMLLLMAVGGMACAWVGTYLFVDLK